jgi:hypothetical protein
MTAAVGAGAHCFDLRPTTTRDLRQDGRGANATEALALFTTQALPRPRSGLQRDERWPQSKNERCLERTFGNGGE